MHMTKIAKSCEHNCLQRVYAGESKHNSTMAFHWSPYRPLNYTKIMPVPHIESLAYQVCTISQYATPLRVRPIKHFTNFGRGQKPTYHCVNANSHVGCGGTQIEECHIVYLICGIVQTEISITTSWETAASNADIQGCTSVVKILGFRV
jgi:hypothetical protein